MKGYLSYGLPGPGFWDAYQELWEESLYRPAFQAPHYLRALAEASEEQLGIYQFYLAGQLSGAALFQKTGKRYHFLSDLKSGQNFFVLHRKLSDEEIEYFFGNLLWLMKRENWAVVLNMQPAWASYMPILNRACTSSHLFWEVVPFALSPILKLDTGTQVAEHLNQSAHLRKKMSQLFRRHEVVFEVLRDDQYLDEWLEAYFHWHVRRWEHTATPSNYSSPRERQLFKACLLGWIEDGLAVRFAFRLPSGERFALCIGLVQENALIDYYMIYDPAYAQYSPAKGLLPFIGKWMEEENLNCLDLGYGEYEYKYEFANDTLEIQRIYLSRYRNLPLIIKAETEKNYREHPQLMAFYRKNIKSLIRFYPSR
jgi:hypothetical protein